MAIRTQSALNRQNALTILATLNNRVRYELAREPSEIRLSSVPRTDTRKEQRGRPGGWEDRQDRKLKRAVNRSFEAISDSTSFGRRREMTAREKPHWSAETARKNTVGRPSSLPLGREATLRESTAESTPRYPSSALLRRLTRSFPRQLRPRGVKETHEFVSTGVRTTLRSPSRVRDLARYMIFKDL